MIDTYIKGAENNVRVNCSAPRAGVFRVAIPVVPVRMKISNLLKCIETYILFDMGTTNA